MVFIVGTPALAFSPGLDEAQQNTVVGGVVVDKNNEPLIGVSVMVEGSSGGTITNMVLCFVAKGFTVNLSTSIRIR